ncbi:MAG TPA: 50S ribosomal protein L4 [Acidimicrobiia bacterium]|jgi:large subunit ribosomal protein L4|nr:50S ribosomal protein L4 [Acidimicrobiia bacterium]
MAGLKAPVFSTSGDATGEIDLNSEVFGIEPNQSLMHQVVTAQLAGARAGTHKTKTRAEVRGGGVKPWRQKGTGRARHGSIRSPIWRGGGVAHGPSPRDYSQRTPKKMKRLALYSALSVRASESAIKVIDSFDWETPRTKEAVGLLAAVEAGGKTLLVLGRNDDTARRAFRNLPQVWITGPDQLSAYDVLWASQVVFTRQSLDVVNGGGVYDISKSDFVRESEAS